MISSTLHSSRSDDARLWLAALLWSLALNGLFVLVLAFLTIQNLIFKTPEGAESEPAPASRSITIEPVTRQELETPKPEDPKGFARTADDQTQEIPENPDFIGERDTVATSETTPMEASEELPSQDGVEPRVGEIETTESDYQDGTLEHDLSANPAAPEPLVTEQPMGPPVESVEANQPSVTESESEEEGVAGPRQRLAEGPFPVDRPVPPDAVEEDTKTSPEERTEDEMLQEEEEVEEQPKPATPAALNEPGFRGFQRRTRLKGSISRTGTSSLDVKEGALGRYHAAIGRAIEQAWQRRVIQHRDLITPGVIRIQVVLDEDGRVRSVGTVEEFGIGVIQKGFTHKAIREADLPKMPDEVRRELQGEPLELLYNFIF